MIFCLIILDNISAINNGTATKKKEIENRSRHDSTLCCQTQTREYITITYIYIYIYPNSIVIFYLIILDNKFTIYYGTINN